MNEINPIEINGKAEALNTEEFSYFYTIRSTVREKSLCKLEMKYLFNIVPEENYLFSYHYVDSSRSAFVKQCLSIIYNCDSLEALTEKIITNKLFYDSFKVRFVDFDDSVDYFEKRRLESVVGFNISGEADMHNPKVLLGLTRVNGRWLFGELEENKNNWKKHNIKLFSYSNALDVRLARALVNIAAGSTEDIKLIDPCCGIGTVVLEALSMGFDIKGCELNPFIAENAQRNLEFFGYENVITNGDMHLLKESFDAAIVDMPYGLFSPTTLKQQLDIISTTRRLAAKAVFISYDNMENYFEEAGFKVIDSCSVAKGNFERHITVCT